jgi:hypothetical protein
MSGRICTVSNVTKFTFGVEYVECKKHIGKWYGGPGYWCECGTQECGYCGGQIVAKPSMDEPMLVVDFATLERALDSFPDDAPTAEQLWDALGG